MSDVLLAVPQGDAAQAQRSFVHSAQRFRLRQALHRASTGTPGLIWLHGKPGTGKTYQARDVLLEAADRGFRTAYVSGHIFRDDPRMPLVLHDLLDQLDPTDMSAWASLARAARYAIETTVHHQPLALVIDAVDLLNDEEAALVEGLLRRPPPGPLFVVFVAQDTGPASERRRRLDRVASDGRARRIEMQNLTLAETRSLIDSWFESEVPSPEFTDEAHELTGGNPHYLVALRDGLERISPAERHAVVTGLSDVAVSCFVPEYLVHHAGGVIRDLSPAAALAFGALAAWGGETDLPTLVALCDLDEWVVMEAVDSLESCALAYARHDSDGVTRVRVEDLALARLVDQTVGLSQGREVHRRAAELREQSLSGATDEMIALSIHYVRGDVALRRDQAEWVIAAATALIQRGRYRRAKACLEFVLPHLDAADADLRARATVLAGRTYVRLGNREKVEWLLAAAADTTISIPADERSSLVRWLARRLVDGGQDQRALQLLADELQHADRLSVTERASLESDAGKIAYQVGKIDIARSLAVRSVERAHGARFHELESTSLVSLGSIDWRSGRPADAIKTGRRAVAAARASGSPRGHARAGALVGLALIDLGSPQRGRRWLLRAHRVATAAGDRSAQSICARSLTNVEFELGEWAQASFWARQTVAIDDGLFRNRHALRTRAALTEILALQGVLPSRSEFARHAVDLDTAPPDVVVSRMLAHATVEQTSGRSTRAAEILDALDESLMGVESIRRDLLVDVLPRRGLLAFGSQDAKTLDRIASRLTIASEAEPAFKVLQLEAIHMRALADSFHDAGPDPARELGLVADAFDQASFGWRSARARLNEGLLLVGVDEKRAASALREAYRRFDEIGARGSLEEARTALDGIGRRPPSRRTEVASHCLTTREVEIATLAAEGLTNPEIAYRLSISPRTVATHIHRILTKAGLQSRVQLGDWLVREARPVVRRSQGA